VRILQVIPTLDPSVGGVAPAMLALSRGLVKRGHEVEIVAIDPPSAPWLRSIDLLVHATGPGLTNYQYSGELNKWLAANGGRYDRVIVNGLWQHPGHAAWRRFARTATPYYVFPHGMLDPWFKRTYPLKHVKKWLYWPWAEYRVMRDAAAVIFTSEQERVEARESFWLYRVREKVSPLGIETPAAPSANVRGKLLDSFPQLRNTRPLLFLGRLHPKKGCDLAIEGFAAAGGPAANMSLVVAGPDQVGWQEALTKRARRLGVESHVVFAGMLQGDLKQSALLNADALILPSHQENFGMAVIEALALGVPVLISNRVNTASEIESDGAGYVQPDDLAGTTALIRRWIQTPPDVKQTMAGNARDCFARRYEINRAVDSLLEILSEPLPGGSRSKR
jgi:glycosyltransferase involved in cell wall biosynthesis